MLFKSEANELEEDTLARIQKIRQRLQNGEKFEELAKQYSLDALSAIKGGDLGWVGPGKLVPPFEAAMNKLKPGEISQPVKSNFGYHLIQVLARKQVDDTDTLRKEQVRQALYQQKFLTEVNDWVRQLRQSAAIKIVDPALSKA
jgi:peptidyl-prolyl cis-trans isomerase SurA